MPPFRIIDNLHPAINRDAQEMDAIYIVGTGKVVIKNNVMQLIGSSGSQQFNLRSFTLGSLTTAINQLAGFSASCLAPTNLSSVVLMSISANTPTTLTMFTSFLYQLLKPVAIALLDALDAQDNSLTEMILTTSDGAWLDAFGELFGINRALGEPDQLYAVRVFNLSVGVRVNNFAIKKALKDLQYDATVDDVEGQTAFDVVVTLPSSPPQGFTYTLSQLADIVDLLRPSGVIYTIKTQGNLSDGVIIGDSYTVSTSSSAETWGSGRIWGQGIWGN